MKLRYIGSYATNSGRLIIGDPFLTDVNIQEILKRDVKDHKMLNVSAEKGVYNMFSSLYADEDGEYCSSHIVVVKDGVLGEVLCEECGTELPLISGNLVTVCDEACFDNPDYSFFNIEYDALYSRKDIMQQCIFKKIKDVDYISSRGDYVTGEELLENLSFVPRLADKRIKSNHWFCDLESRCDNSMNAATYYGGCVAVCKNVTTTVRMLRTTDGNICGAILSLGQFEEQDEKMFARMVFNVMRP